MTEDEIVLRLHANLHERLAELGRELAALREALRIADEQVAYQESVAGEARIRALVDGSPLTERERRVADGDLARLGRERSATLARMEALTRRQNELLERLQQERT